MDTIAQPTSLGVGETESFLLSDPAPFMPPFRPVTMKPTGFFGRFVGVIVPPEPTEVERRMSRLQQVGFTSLMPVERTAIRLDSAATLYPELVGKDKRLWQKFLPTQNELGDYRYDSITDEALSQIEIAMQLDCFDRIVIWTPEGNTLPGRMKRRMDRTNNRLLAVWDRVSDGALDLSYRMSERMRRARRTSIRAARAFIEDPMAVGIIEDANGVERQFPIVRWGESLLPKKEVAGFVKKVDRQERALAVGIIGALLMPVLFMVRR